MTAINVIRQREAVHVITDGVFCDNTGMVCEIAPNVFAMPHLAAALAIRGSTHFMPFLVHRLSRECRTFDDLVAKIVRTAREVHMSFPMAFGSLAYGAIVPDFDLVAVGWKTSGMAASYLISNHERIISKEVTTSAWQLLELPEVLVAPPIDEAQVIAMRWQVPYSGDTFRPAVDGVALLEAQRLTPRELDPRSGTRGFVHVVGGFAQVTSVTRHGVHSDVLRWWPDAVGRKINPQDPAAPSPQLTRG
jgi:hypothetical protein